MMKGSGALLVLSTVLTNSIVAADVVLGAALFQRHGDRTAKVLGDTHLTILGQVEEFNSGSFWRSRYLKDGSADKIFNLSSTYDSDMSSAWSPDSATLQKSGISFLQGMYPPNDEVMQLANGTNITAPLNGYDAAIVNGVEGSAADSIWIKGDDSCPTFQKASNQFYDSEQFHNLNKSSLSYYQGFSDRTKGVFNESMLNFANAYMIYDYFNTGYMHNASVRQSVTAEELKRLQDLSDIHEYGLNWNASNTDRAIGGKTLLRYMEQTLGGLINTATTKNDSAIRLSTYFGSYDTMIQFFGITDLVQDDDMMGLPVYASTIAMELRAPSLDASESDFAVRMLFRNGSDAEAKPYKMFGSSKTDMPWSEFVKNVNSVSIASPKDWCDICQSKDNFCTSRQYDSSYHNGQPISNAVAGVIGAVVALVFASAIVAFIYMFGRFRRGGQKFPSRSQYPDQTVNIEMPQKR